MRSEYFFIRLSTVNSWYWLVYTYSLYINDFCRLCLRFHFCSTKKNSSKHFSCTICQKILNTFKSNQSISYLTFQRDNEKKNSRKVCWFHFRSFEKKLFILSFYRLSAFFYFNFYLWQSMLYECILGCANDIPKYTKILFKQQKSEKTKIFLVLFRKDGQRERKKWHQQKHQMQSGIPQCTACRSRRESAIVRKRQKIYKIKSIKLTKLLKLTKLKCDWLRADLIHSKCNIKWRRRRKRKIDSLVGYNIYSIYYCLAGDYYNVYPLGCSLFLLLILNVNKL